MNTNTADSVCLADSFRALKLKLVPKTIQDGDEELQSFAHIKKKTMTDLYGVGGNDKSPKGSVDVAIRPLVNLINLHPSYATLSSCSGRIALFDPHLIQQEDSEHTQATEDEVMECSLSKEKSGKGHGAWLLASHEEVAPSTLVDLLDEPGEARETLIFKHEPLLLHVAASSLKRGQQLLSVALQLGFRESGIVVSSNRVTVAIRTHSLALCVPLARRGPLRPPHAYLGTLVKEANTRMQSNQEKLQRLYGSVQETLFMPAPAPQVLCATISKLPPLNLWNHAAVAVPIGSSGDVDVLVFGGYGQGPDLSESEQNGRSKRCGRSNSIFCLSRRDGAFQDKWSAVKQVTLSDEERLTPFMSSIGVEVRPVDFLPREGLAACVLPTEKDPVVAVWGGRASPGKPFNDVLLYEPCSTRPVFMKPIDIRGEPPEGRWGHSLSALSGEGGLMAVLVGGRNEKTTFGTLYILTLIMKKPGLGHLHWTKVDLGLPGRFHHTTVGMNGSMFVFGGLSDTSVFLGSFADSYRSSKAKSASQLGISAFDLNSAGVAILKDGDDGDESIDHMGRSIGGASCVVKVSDAIGGTTTLVALTGGVSSNTPESEPIQWCELKTDEDAVAVIPRHDIKIDAGETVDFGSMVHHSCVTLPSPPDYGEILLIGGGVSSFAFGPSFAE